ncbi:unnamed protein product [Echinostoma caproni]|uniref:Death domain-containing protein n=1 Tax=Echinostoma caproni TaxID=27848 RepID=A0A183APM4_9TREM|nr:unnamed protein product [Echinostoma caproni]
MQLTVEAIDPSAQIGLDNYRGFLDIYCMREVLTAFSPGRAVRFKAVHNRSRKARFQVKIERTHLARIVVKLPKLTIPISDRMAVPNFEFVSKDVITQKYLRELSKKLPGDTWRRLGMALDLPRARIQAIGGKSASAVEDYAYAMFLSWIKTLPVSADRVNLLHQGLMAIGRSDLATELRQLTADYVHDGSDTST